MTARNDRPTSAAKDGTVSAIGDLARCEREERVFPEQELRADADARKILGFIPYDSKSRLIGGWFTEIIRPGAFKRALSGDHDPRGYWGHDRLHVLGRQSNGTLRLRDTDEGLRYEIDVPETQWATDLLVSIDRGDVDGSSFGFVVDRSDGERWERDDDSGAVTRELLDVKLVDVSPVAEAAYPAARVSARSLLRANQIDPDELANATGASEPSGPTDPETREVVVRAITALRNFIGFEEGESIDESEPEQTGATDEPTEPEDAVTDEPSLDPDESGDAVQSTPSLNLLRRKLDNVERWLSLNS